MLCPDKEVLQDLVDNALPEEKVTKIMEHVKSCGECKKEVRQLLKLCKAFGEAVAEDLCPSLEILAGYAKNSLTEKELHKIKEHVEFCERCESYVWLFKASESELTIWEEKERLLFQKAEAERIGFNTTNIILNELLHPQGVIFSKLWEFVLTITDDLRHKAVKQWPTFDRSDQLAGVLGFYSHANPELIAGAIIASTTLIIAYKLVDGEIKAEERAIAENVRQIAACLGAGKELQNRLVERIPHQIINEMVT